MSIADFITFLAPGIYDPPSSSPNCEEGSSLKHLEGQHDQQRHAWRYGSLENARRSLQGQADPVERDEYRRRAGMEPVRPAAGAPMKAIRSHALSASVIQNYELTHRENIEYGWADADLDGDPLDFVRKAYNVYDSGTGLRADVIDISYSRWEHQMTVSGRIYDRQGNVAGAFDRSVRFHDNSVHHDLLKIDEKYQKSGYGSRLYQHAEKVYEKIGIERVELHANLDVGGYAWARMGFDFFNRHVRDEFIATLWNVWYRRYRADIPKAIGRHLKHAWDLASLRGPDGYEIGKMTMLGTSWDAEKFLSKRSLGYRIGKMYYRYKRKQ